MQTTTAERRSATRFQVGLPVLMDGQECSLQQLSPRGLLLRASAPPTPGRQVRLQLRYEADDGSPEMVGVTGDILRVQVDAGAFHVAVRLHDALY